MTNDDDHPTFIPSTYYSPQLLKGLELTEKDFKRPPSPIDDFTYESRGIQKLADAVRDMVEDFIDEYVIDPDYPSHEEDEELEMYRANRCDIFIEMVCKSLLGSDRIGGKEEEN